jgi:acyl carrier protein
MPDSVAERVIAIIAKAKKIPAESVSIDATFEELKIDSLDGLNVFFEIEEAFDLSIPDETARGMRSVRQVVEALEQQLSGQKDGDKPVTTQEA